MPCLPFGLSGEGPRAAGPGSPGAPPSALGSTTGTTLRQGGVDSEGGGAVNPSFKFKRRASVQKCVAAPAGRAGVNRPGGRGARRFNRVRMMALALLLASGSLAAPASQPPRPLQEVYPVFWAVGGNVRQEAPFQANGSVDLPRFGIKMNNWTICGGWTAINHSRAEAFPSLDDDGTVHNGGVPQAMNTSYFLQMLSTNIAEKIPDPNWAGLGVFECVQASPAARCRRSVLDCTEATCCVSLAIQSASKTGRPSGSRTPRTATGTAEGTRTTPLHSCGGLIQTGVLSR